MMPSFVSPPPFHFHSAAAAVAATHTQRHTITFRNRRNTPSPKHRARGSWTHKLDQDAQYLSSFQQMKKVDVEVGDR